MGKKDIACAIEQKVSAGLIDVFLAPVFARHALAKQFQVELQSRRRKYVKQRQAFERELFVRCPFWIGKDKKRPLMQLLILR